MAFTIEIISSDTPQISELTDALEAAAWANARWFRSEKAAGREPPCCLDCAEVCYMPDQPSSQRARFYTGGELIARGRASCGEIAAYHLGVLRAKGSGRMGRIRVRRRDDEVLHAVVELAGGRVIDPSRELERCDHG